LLENRNLKKFYLSRLCLILFFLGGGGTFIFRTGRKIEKSGISSVSDGR